MSTPAFATIRLEERLVEDLRELRGHAPNVQALVLSRAAARLEEEQEGRAWGDHRTRRQLEDAEPLGRIS